MQLARRRHLVSLLFLLVMAPVLPQASPSHTRRGLTINDVLQMENIGRTILTPDKRSLIYESIAPYAQAPNLGAVATGYDRSALAKLRIVNFDSPSTTSDLFPQDTDAGYWASSLSPDEKAMVVYRLKAGRLAAGVLDLQSRTVVWFSFTPSCCFLVSSPVWVSNDELIYATVPEGEPAVLGNRGLIAKLNERWSKTLEGIEPSATLLRSTADGLSDVDSFESGALIRVNIRTGATRKLADGSFFNLEMSPDRRFIAGLRLGGQIQPRPNESVTADWPRRAQLVIVNPSGEAAPLTPCPRCNVIPKTLAWSIEDSYFTYLAYNLGDSIETTKLQQFSPDRNTLSTLDIRQFQFACGTALLRPIRPVPLSPHAVAVYGRTRAAGSSSSLIPPDRCRWDESNDWFLLSPHKPPRNLTGTLTDVSGDVIGAIRTSLFLMAAGDIWKVPTTGPLRRLTSATKNALRPWRPELRYLPSATPIEPVRPPDMQTVLESQDEVVLLDLQRTKIATVAKPSADAILLNLTPDGNTSIFAESLETEARIIALDRQNRVHPLVEINQHLSDVSPSIEVTVRYELADVGRVTSCLLLPFDRTPGKRYPVVVYVYPDSSGTCQPSKLSSISPLDFNNVELLTARGYGVLFAATPAQALRKPEGPTRGITSAVLAAVDQAIQDGYADPQRLGLYGFSQGFHEVLQILTETTRFKAAFAGNGIADFLSHYGQLTLLNRLEPQSLSFLGNPGRYEGPFASTNSLGPRPWENPLRYIRNSPVFYADRIQTPLLLMHSDFDIFPLAQSEEIFMALYRLRKEAAYVTYWGEGHGNLSPANIRDAWQRIFQWFDTHL